MQNSNRLNKKEFEATMDIAIELNSNYIVMIVQLPDLIAPEAIVNSRANFELKKKYICEAYDDNMDHKYSKGVAITEVIICDTLREVALAINKSTYITHNTVH